MSSIRYGIAAVLATTMVIAGCAKGDRSASDSAAMANLGDTAAARMDTAGRRADSMASNVGETRGGWSDAAVFGFATAANTGEITEGTLAERKATNPAVKAFARQMVTDHRAMLAEGKALASKIKATADTTADEAKDLMKDSRDEIKDLTDKKAGKDWDEDFIEKQIDGHKKVLDKLQDAAKSTNNAEVRAMLEKAVGKVQQHLTKAEDIKNNQLKS